jgi:receptor-type tyrosine-protein phosphatase T
MQLMKNYITFSAGIGRTGTFLAVDILYDQGKDLGYLDVFLCVRDLRDQRVNMVQTKV